MAGDSRESGGADGWLVLRRTARLLLSRGPAPTAGAGRGALPLPRAGEGSRSPALPVLGAVLGRRECYGGGNSDPSPLVPGPVTNAFIVLAPANMVNPDGKPSVPLPKFSKHLHGTESNDEQGSEGVTLRLGLHQQVPGTGQQLGRGMRGSGRGLCCRVHSFAGAAAAAGPC